MAKSRKKFLCIDCQVDTGKIYEHYFIHTELWLQIMPSTSGMLCIDCCESRLGRSLRKSDFPPVWINNPKYEPKSKKLVERLNS